MDIINKLKNMSDHDLLLFNIAETRSIRKLLTNHLTHHEKQDDRRWRVYLILFGVFVTAIAGVVAALLVP